MITHSQQCYHYQLPVRWLKPPRLLLSQCGVHNNLTKAFLWVIWRDIKPLSRLPCRLCNNYQLYSTKVWDNIWMPFMNAITWYWQNNCSYYTFTSNEFWRTWLASQRHGVTVFSLNLLSHCLCCSSLKEASIHFESLDF